MTFERDGEFWMSFRDFSAHYSRLEIVNLNADSLEEEELSGNKSKRWQANEFVGNWVKGASAGGCRNHLGMPELFTCEQSVCKSIYKCTRNFNHLHSNCLR